MELDEEVNSDLSMKLPPKSNEDRAKNSGGTSKQEEKVTPNSVSYGKVGGYRKELRIIENLVKSALNKSSTQTNPVRGILLYGPPGTGKLRKFFFY